MSGEGAAGPEAAPGAPAPATPAAPAAAPPPPASAACSAARAARPAATTLPTCFRNRSSPARFSSMATTAVAWQAGTVWKGKRGGGWMIGRVGQGGRALRCHPLQPNPDRTCVARRCSKVPCRLLPASLPGVTAATSPAACTLVDQSRDGSSRWVPHSGPQGDGEGTPLRSGCGAHTLQWQREEGGGCQSSYRRVQGVVGQLPPRRCRGAALVAREAARGRHSSQGWSGQPSRRRCGCSLES